MDFCAGFDLGRLWCIKYANLIFGGGYMREINLALLGGDKREMELARLLAGCRGCRVRCFGLPGAGQVRAAASLADAVCGADALLLPMAGVDEQGRLFAPMIGEVCLRREDLALAKPGTPVLVGVASGYLRGLCSEQGLPLIALAGCDEVALPNAVPTAEGAIALLMAETEVTVNDMQLLVLGFGRVGEALALRLRALGARVCVSNRGEKRLKRAQMMGFDIADWEAWPGALGQCVAVINTVPALVLGQRELQLMQPDALVIDLASGAGGVDWAAADELGLRARHELGLPGRVAPVTAGRILGRAYIKCLRDDCGLAVQWAENWDENGDENLAKRGGDLDGGR